MVGGRVVHREKMEVEGHKDYDGWAFLGNLATVPGGERKGIALGVRYAVNTGTGKLFILTDSMAEVHTALNLSLCPLLGRGSKRVSKGP